MAREKKKKLDLSASSEVVLGDTFALDVSGLPEGTAAEPEEKVEGRSPSPKRTGKVVLRRERKGRKGKTVTLVEGLEEKGKEMEETARQLRRDLGCGSHVEGTVVVLQGDQVERGEAWFRKKGFRNVVRGN